jgi:sugar phosphate isomerase/epimerase
MPLLGNVNHAAAWWCSVLDRATVLKTRPDEPHPLTTQGLADICKELGIKGMELAPTADYPLLAQLGLVNPMAFVNPYAAENIPPFVRGFNNPLYRNRVVNATVAEIDLMAEYGWPNCIAFIGYAVDPTDGGAAIGRDDAFTNCVEGLKRVAKHAEAKNVTVCVEHLNTRDGSHPMKGHPGYQGDDLDFVTAVVRAVGSPRLKVLFDIYHVQVMHGDVTRRLTALVEEGMVGHIHTAGCPGRGELGKGQELCYTSVMTAAVKAGYKGWTGHEHIPTWDSKRKSLLNSVVICDV